MTEAAEVLDPQTPPEQPNPRDIARAVAMDVADAPEQVGEVVDAIELDDNVTDFRLAADVRGYEGWQWSVTLYHDVEVGTWTVNESSLVPTDDRLRYHLDIAWDIQQIFIFIISTFNLRSSLYKACYLFVFAFTLISIGFVIIT